MAHPSRFMARQILAWTVMMCWKPFPRPCYCMHWSAPVACLESCLQDIEKGNFMPHAQRGFTLVELAIAKVFGYFVKDWSQHMFLKCVIRFAVLVI
jgi:hypothetical protein